MLVTLLWALVGVLAGVAYVVVVPWLSARMAGTQWIERVAGWYVWAAQTFIGRAAVIIRDEELDLVAKTYDDAYQADKDTAGDEPRHHRDVFGVLNRLRNRVFGFAPADRNVWVSPLMAEIGAKAYNLHQEDDLGPDVARVDGQDRQIPVMHDGIPIPERSQLVDLSNARHLVKGRAEPKAAEDAYERTKISQEPFTQTVSPAQGLLIMAGFVGALVAVLYLGGENGNGGQAGNETVLSALPVLTVAGAALGDRLADALERGRERVAGVLEGGGGQPPAGGKPLPTGKLKAALVAAGGVLVIPLVALVTFGWLTAALVLVLQAATIVAVPVGVWFAGPVLPGFLAKPLAKIAWLLAQITTDGGVIVERDTGVLEYHELRRHDGDAAFECTLNNGETLLIDGTEGDLYRFAWNDLGVVAEKSGENMDKLTPDNIAARGDDEEIVPTNDRVGYRPLINPGNDGDWCVTLPHLESWADGSATGAAIRTGRQKALREQGGGQGLGQLVFTLLLVGAPLLGAVMGWLMI